MLKNVLLTSLLTGWNKASHHDYFNPLGHRIGLVVLFFSQHTSKVAQLPDWAAFTTFPRQLHTQTCVSTHRYSSWEAGNSFLHPNTILSNVAHHFYLQDQGDTSREEGHEDKVIGQNRHTAKTTHDL